MLTKERHEYARSATYLPSTACNCVACTFTIFYSSKLNTTFYGVNHEK